MIKTDLFRLIPNYYKMKILPLIGLHVSSLVSEISGNSVPLGFKSQKAFDFDETETEINSGWKIENRCGQSALTGSEKDQRFDPKCPNVLLINTDDMSWADISINNPSKVIPTPNIDRLVSKEILQIL